LIKFKPVGDRLNSSPPLPQIRLRLTGWVKVTDTQVTNFVPKRGDRSNCRVDRACRRCQRFDRRREVAGGIRQARSPIAGAWLRTGDRTALLQV
jgi:hypothetical protein